MIKRETIGIFFLYVSLFSIYLHMSILLLPLLVWDIVPISRVFFYNKSMIVDPWICFFYEGKKKWRRKKREKGMEELFFPGPLKWAKNFNEMSVSFFALVFTRYKRVSTLTSDSLVQLPSLSFLLTSSSFISRIPYALVHLCSNYAGPFNLRTPW